MQKDIHFKTQPAPVAKNYRKTPRPPATASAAHAVGRALV